MEESQKKIHKSILFAYVTSIITFISSIAGCMYALLFCKDNINQTYLIISSIIILIFSGLLVSAIFLQKKKMHYTMLGTAFIFIFGFIIFNLLSLMNIIKLPTLDTLKSFYNTNINDALIWGKKNSININQVYEYSDTIAEYNIITQDIPAGTLLKDVKEINFLVSGGPSLDKQFILQSLIGLKIDEAMEIINSNFMNNIEINYEINDTYEKDTIINQNISGEIRRSDLLTLTVSLGKEGELVPVELIDFKGKSLFDAELWLKRNGIKYEKTYEFSDTIERNYCISQNEQAGTVVNPNDTIITIIISKGKEITIPDFTTMTVHDATVWVSEHKLKLKFIESYDNELDEGKIISSSHAINTKVEEGETITLTISKGKLKMEKFDSVSSFRSWANGLGLEYEENAEFSDKISGEIINIKPNVGEIINLNEKIYVTYSKGKSTTVPNFYNKTKNEATTLCNNYALNCYFTSRYSNNVSSGNIMYQSMYSGSEVAQGTSITLQVSSGPEPKKEVPVNTCTSTETHNLIIQPNWITGGSASTTISTLKSKLSVSYPKVTFNYTTKAGNRTSGYIHVDSPITSGSTIQDCKTYTIIINE